MSAVSAVDPLELIFVDDADTAACTSGRPATYAECNAKSESIPPAYASVTHMTNDARPAGCVFVLSTGAYKYNYGTGDTPSELMAHVSSQWITGFDGGDGGFDADM